MASTAVERNTCVAECLNETDGGGRDQSIQRNNCATAILFTTNLKWTVRKSSQDLCDEGQATNGLSYGTSHQ